MAKSKLQLKHNRLLSLSRHALAMRGAKEKMSISDNYLAEEASFILLYFIINSLEMEQTTLSDVKQELQNWFERNDIDDGGYQDMLAWTKKFEDDFWSPKL